MHTLKQPHIQALPMSQGMSQGTRLTVKEWLATVFAVLKSHVGLAIGEQSLCTSHIPAPPECQGI